METDKIEDIKAQIEWINIHETMFELSPMLKLERFLLQEELDKLVNNQNKRERCINVVLIKNSEGR